MCEYFVMDSSGTLKRYLSSKLRSKILIQEQVIVKEAAVRFQPPPQQNSGCASFC